MPDAVYYIAGGLIMWCVLACVVAMANHIFGILRDE